MSKVAHLSAAMATGQVALVSYSPTVGPDRRASYVYTYEGTDAGVSVLSNLLRSLGAAIKSDYADGVARVSATFTFDPGADPANAAITPPAEVPVETYRIAMGAQGISLFALPKATREAKLYAGVYSDTLNVVAYKVKIQEAIDKGTSLSVSLNSTDYPFAQAIYRSLSRGVTEEQVLHPTLIRTKTFSYKYNVRLRVSYTQDVWTTSALSRIFEIPSDVADSLPFAPEAAPVDGNWGTPDNATWGWKLIDQGLDYDVARREWKESVTWLFGSWDNDIYKITSA